MVHLGCCPLGVDPSDPFGERGIGFGPWPPSPVRRPSRRSRRSVRPRRAHTVASPSKVAELSATNWKRLAGASPGEILGRPLEDLPLGGQLRRLDLELAHPRSQPGQLLLGTLQPGRRSCRARGAGSRGAVGAVVLPVPYRSTQCLKVPRTTPRSAADCPSASRPGWTRTSRRPADGTPRSSSCGPWFLDHLASPADAGFSVSKNQGAAPSV